MFTDTNIGLGFGDMFTGDGYTVSDIRCAGPVCNNNSVEDVLYSQNNKFRAQFDVNGDGLGDNRDLFALSDHLVAGGAGQAVLDSYTDLLLKRGDVNSSGTADGNDVAALYASFGSPSWLMDMNVDGAVDIDDVSTMITELFRTVTGDFNVDGSVDAADYVLWRKGLGSGTTYSQGDADLDGDVDSDDLAAWQSAFGFVRQPLMAGSGSAAHAVPEPGTLVLAAIVFAICGLTTTTPRTQRKLGKGQR